MRAWPESVGVWPESESSDLRLVRRKGPRNQVLLFGKRTVTIGRAKMDIVHDFYKGGSASEMPGQSG